MKTTNTEILDTALQEFAAHGYDGTKLTDLSDRLHITKGALYKHYDGKESLWNAMIDRLESYYMEHIGFQSENICPETAAELLTLTMTQVTFTLHDSIVKNIRQLLTIEQFRNERMAKLATKHFITDIESFYTAVFSAMTAKGIFTPSDVSLLVLEYTSPITILIHLCDREPETETSVLDMIQKHIYHFFELHACSLSAN